MGSNFLDTIFKGVSKVKKEFPKDKVKNLLGLLKGLMEIVSPRERARNENLMRQYETIFLGSLIYFDAEEIWAN